MNEAFFKFPTTPHLVIPAGVDIRKDKVLTEGERNDFLRHEIVIEEKIDGANLGISFDSKGNIRAQNRGSYLEISDAGQWKLLGEWLAPRMGCLFDELCDRYILFGEWCYAQHSVFYNRLPDWFLGFDVFDCSVGKFLSTTRRNHLFQNIGIAVVPFLARGKFSLQSLNGMLTSSRFSDSLAEGIYFRYDEGNRLGNRAKLVHSGFIQSIGAHWSKNGIRPNRVVRKTH